MDLAGFLRYAKVEYDLPIIESFLEATPTAELEPITDQYVQSDEQVRAPKEKIFFVSFLSRVASTIIRVQQPLFWSCPRLCASREKLTTMFFLGHGLHV